MRAAAPRRAALRLGLLLAGALLLAPAAVAPRALAAQDEEPLVAIRDPAVSPRVMAIRLE